MIEAKNIYKKYEDRMILKGINLKIKLGEILGVIGPNGAGKTTLMRIMAGIKKPDQGEISLLDFNPLTNNSIRKKIAYMPERIFFEDGMSGYMFLKLMGKFSGLDKNKLNEIIAMCGIEESIHRKIQKYSKGMVQRLLMAQTLLNDPFILFLDEPNSGIDPQGTKRIRDIILEMNHKGRTFIINSHELTELERICTRVVFLKDGQIVSETDMQEKSNKYCLEIKGDESKAAQLLKNLNIDFEKINDATFSLNLQEDSIKDDILKKFLIEGISIESFKRKEHDLEELFFKYVKEDQNESNN